MPYEERVDRAVAKIQSTGTWTGPQKTWLKRIGDQLKKEIVVDEVSFTEGAFTNWGGWKGMDKNLGGRLKDVLETLGDEIWRDAA